MPVFTARGRATQSHQFAIEAATFGGGQAASKTLRQAGFLACGIGLPRPAVEGDMNGLRLGTPELVRWGMGVADMDRLGGMIADALSGRPDPAAVSQWRRSFDRMRFIHA